MRSTRQLLTASRHRGCLLVGILRVDVLTAGPSICPLALVTHFSLDCLNLFFRVEVLTAHTPIRPLANFFSLLRSFICLRVELLSGGASFFLENTNCQSSSLGVSSEVYLTSAGQLSCLRGDISPVSLDSGRLSDQLECSHRGSPK